MLRPTSHHGSSAGFWNTNANRCGATGVPTRLIAPPAGFSSPASSRSNVDLPQPLGPTMAVHGSRLHGEVEVAKDPLGPGRRGETEIERRYVNVHDRSFPHVPTFLADVVRPCLPRNERSYIVHDTCAGDLGHRAFNNAVTQLPKGELMRGTRLTKALVPS